MADWDWGMKKTGKSNADSRERVSYLVLEVTFWSSLFHLCPGLNAAAKFSIYANLDVSPLLQWLGLKQLKLANVRDLKDFNVIESTFSKTDTFVMGIECPF